MLSKKELFLAKTYDRSKSKEPSLTVILIHGIASDSSRFKKSLSFFSHDKKLNDVRFVTFDLLGAGKSLTSDELEYNYAEQLAALHNSIKSLEINTPIVLLGHSLGTFIVTRYATVYPNNIKHLILVSPPVYTKKDFKNPAFKLGMDMFKKALSIKNPTLIHKKEFTASMDNIVLSPDNYEVLSNIKIPTTFIYGTEDQLIAPYNIPEILKHNQLTSEIRTRDKHSITQVKIERIAKVLEDINAKDL